MFFGGGRGRGGGGERKTKSMVHQLPVTLKDLYVGKTAKLAVQRNIICSDCEGLGGKKGAVQQCKVKRKKIERERERGCFFLLTFGSSPPRM